MGFHFFGQINININTSSNWDPRGDAECVDLDLHSTMRAMMTTVNSWKVEREL